MQRRVLLPALLFLLPFSQCLLPSSADDTADLRALVEKFFAVYAKKELDGFMALWSEKSPEYASSKQATSNAFDQNDYLFANIVSSRVKVEGEMATLRAVVDMTTVNAKTKEAKKEAVTRAFAFNKEASGWKVWRYYPAADDLAAALIAAKTEDERKALLADDKELVTVELTPALVTQSNRLYSTGNYSQALSVYRLAQGIAEQIGDRVGIARTLVGIGNVHLAQGRYAEALDSYQKSLTIKEALGDRVGIAATLNNIGEVHRLQGRYAEALDSYQKSLTIREAVGDRAGIAGTLNNIGLVHKSQGRYAEALDSFQKSRMISEALGERDGIARTLNNIGLVHHLQGRYAEALDSYQKSLTISEGLGYRAAIAATLNNIGIVHRLQARYAEALDSYQKSLTISEALGDRARIALTLNIIGAVHEKQGRYAEAMEFYQKSLTIKEALGDRVGIAITLSNIGEIHQSQARYMEALDSYQKSLTIAEAIGDPDTALWCHWGMGSTYKAQGRKDDAVAAYRKAIGSLEQIRGGVAGGEEERLTYLHDEGKDDIYQSLVSLLVEQGNVKEALRLLERARSKQLLDGIRLRSLTVRDDNVRKLLERTEELEEAIAVQERTRLSEISKLDAQQNKTKLANLTQLIAQTREQLLEVTNTIRDANPDYERFINVKAPDLESIQQHLPKNVIVVEYVPLDTALMAILVTHEKLEARSIAVSRQRLDDLVNIVRSQMQRAQRDATFARDWYWSADRARPLRDALTSLYGYLIAPLQRDLEKAETVIIVPSGMLNYLPYASLAKQKADGSLVFFTEEKPLAVLTSLLLWQQIVKKEQQGAANRNGAHRFSGFGNPDGTLPLAEQEVKRVGALFEQSLIYTGNAATRARLENLPADVTLAHIATHGNLNQRDLNECYLTMANGEKLKLGEIYGLAGRYPARMTVLSACETAMGGRNPGGEVAHLANGFVEAGSTTIIASLWKVSDESTATLMERFYKELKAGKTKAEAKRLAEISLLKDPKTAHPYYWAPFVLIGDWR